MAADVTSLHRKIGAAQGQAEEAADAEQRKCRSPFAQGRVPTRQGTRRDDSWITLLRGGFPLERGALARILRQGKGSALNQQAILVATAPLRRNASQIGKEPDAVFAATAGSSDAPVQAAGGAEEQLHEGRARHCYIEPTLRGDHAMLISFLLWLHFIGMGMAVGGGIALSQVGPRLIVAPAEQRELLWVLEIFFSRIGAGGLALLLVTGPLMLWLRFGGPGGLSWWFSAKMGFVLAALIGVSLHEWAGRRFRKGDVGAVPMMFFAGRMAGISMVLAMLCAVFTFT